VAAAIALIALSLLVYTYVAYPIVVAILARLSPLRTKTDDGWLPHVTACIPVFNAARYVAPKLDSLLALDYPADKLEILILSDGSTDESEAIVSDYAARSAGRVRLIRAAARSGKPTALNLMRAEAKGEVLLLTDIRQPLAATALRAMVTRLADPNVACVSGNLTLPDSAGAGVYWKYENWIRKSEARFRSMLGVTGPIYVIRKVDLPHVPPDVILDDMWIPMQLRLKRRRLLFCEEAVALDEAFGDEREFGRKVRTLAGNYQLFARMPALLVPFVNPSWFELLSHKLMRLVCPWLLVAFFVASAWAAQPWAMGAFTLDAVWLMRAFALGQVFLLLLAAAGTRAGRAGVVYRTFLVLNFAALVGLWRFVRGSQKITW
jgi:cellulose synthase/poly-beta-1,6-N-acetylglucosamine synthase-like glycosyltransferase